MVMRQPKTFFVLVGFACVLGMTGCGGSKPATPTGNSQKATVQAAQPAIGVWVHAPATSHASVVHPLPSSQLATVHPLGAVTCNSKAPERPL